MPSEDYFSDKCKYYEDLLWQLYFTLSRGEWQRLDKCPCNKCVYCKLKGVLVEKGYITS